MLLTFAKIALTIPVAYALAYPFLNPTVDAGMFRELKMVGPIAGIAITAAFLVAVFLYCRDLQRTLALVRPDSRAASPRSVWLMFLLPYNFVEDFFIIANVAKSLRREAQHNQALRSFKGFGLVSGFGWCSAQIVSLIPHEVGSLAGVLALLAWVIHWRFIRNANRLLSESSQTNSAFERDCAKARSPSI